MSPTRETVAVVAGYGLLAIAATWPLVRHVGHALPGDLGDPLLSAWILGWDADRLRHGLAGVWHAPILFPNRYTLAYAEHLLGVAIFTAPIVWATANPILAYNVAFIASYVLAGAGMYLLARSLTGRRDAAFIAGLVYAFGPPRVAHITHLQVLVSGWMPIALWGLHQYFIKGSIAALALFIAAFAIQVLSNGYFLFFLVIPVLIVVAVELVWNSDVRPARARRIAQLAAAAGAILLILAPVVTAYLTVRQQYGFRRSVEEWIMFSADVRSYFSAADTVRLWGPWLDGDRAPERQLFPGLVALVLAAIALWPERRPRRATIVYASIAAVAFVLSLGPAPSMWGHRITAAGPYLWLTRILPGLDGLRAPARFSIVVLVALAVLAAFGTARLFASISLRAARIAAAIVAAVVVVEGWAPIRLAAFNPDGTSWDRALYRWLARSPPGGVLELPIKEWAISPTLKYQYATLRHGHQIVNGYSGYGSSLQEFLGGAATPLNDLERIDEALDLLRAVGIRYVVVHPDDYEDRATGVKMAAAIRADRSRVVEELRANDDRAAVAFRLKDSDAITTAIGGTRRVESGEFTASASHAPDRFQLALDGNRDTRWVTGEPQRDGQWIRIEFTRPRDIARLVLQMARRSSGDYPRHLLIESTAADGETAVLYDDGVLIPFGRALIADGAYPAIALDLPVNRSRMLTIRQTGRTRSWIWSVHELMLFERE